MICREKRDKRTLTRLVFTDAGLRVDATGKMNGRGAYLCEKPGCWQNAAARKTLDSALKRALNAEDRMELQRLAPT